jgi:3' exoribonuclease, RNase T-like
MTTEDQRFTDVMIDLETLGTAPGSVILSIGAVAFAEGMEEADWATFDSGPIDVAGSRRFHGLRIQEGTLAWWLKQEPEAAQLLVAALENGTSPTQALGAFVRWFPPQGARMWGNGSDFDNVLLRVAFDAASVTCPWSYSNNRCYRTLKRAFENVPPPEFQGVKHDALADALHQTRHLQAILAHIKEAR